ncbi:zinc ribbon domain-containing protein [Ottowia sp. VDI28]|uniref:zinc ribbon domain-containing protein n=1 Tax=Ottowia sp. VDI28 TaxID=3133968 RepID=UPI003C2ED160
MALISCPECGHTISTKAQACPSCGYVLKPSEQDGGVVRCSRRMSGVRRWGSSVRGWSRRGSRA